IKVEHLPEHGGVLVARDEHRLQRAEHVVAVLDGDQPQRLERIDHRARPDGQTRGAQRAGEGDDVIGEMAAVVRVAHIKSSNLLLPGGGEKGGMRGKLRKKPLTRPPTLKLRRTTSPRKNGER